MEILLLLLLMVSAGVLFVPGLLKERALDSPVTTVSDFKRGMTALAISTHNQPSRYYSHTSEPEPYVRRSHFTEQVDERADDFVPYPSARRQAEMQARRRRVLVILLLVVLTTGIIALIPTVRWIIPVHIAFLLILTAYIGLAILTPGAGRGRR